MAVPQQLLQQLLALDESVRLEIAHTLLESVDARVDQDMSDDERKRLDAALDRSIAQADAGQTVPFDEVMAALRAKRTTRAAR
jgi:predicted transcriptional regulator